MLCIHLLVCYSCYSLLNLPLTIKQNVVRMFGLKGHMVFEDLWKLLTMIALLCAFQVVHKMIPADQMIQWKSNDCYWIISHVPHRFIYQHEIIIRFYKHITLIIKCSLHDLQHEAVEIVAACTLNEQMHPILLIVDVAKCTWCEDCMAI